MSYLNRRLALAFSLLAGLPHFTQGIDLLRHLRQPPVSHDFEPHLRRGRAAPFEGRRGYADPRTGRRIFERPAVPYAQLSPKVDGVRMRWQDGKLVPRSAPQPARVVLAARTQRRARRDAAKQARGGRR